MPLTQKTLPSSACRGLWLIARPLLAMTVALLFVSLTACVLQGKEEESGRVIADVRIEGNQTIPESVILQKIQSQPNRPLTERQLREDIRSLQATRWFFNVDNRLEETPEGPVLIFTVHERPIVQKVTFIGNKKVKLKYLTAWTGLKAGSPFDHQANQEAVGRIEQEYREKGFFFVKVVLEKGGRPGEREIVFRIEEGPKVRVQHRTFEGNQFWTDGDLRKNLQSKEALLGLFGGFYKPDLLPQDVEAVKEFYKGVGFFDVEVTATPRFSSDRSAVDLHFVIVENTRYSVREIHYQGNAIISTSQLKQDSELLPGDKFNSHPLGKDVRRMLKYYGDMGHYFASVEPVPHFTQETGVVDLVFEIDEDRPRYIRQVNVTYEGDYPHTKQTVVLDRLQLGPGDLADPNLLRRSRSRLNGSQLFEPGLEFEVIPVEPGEMSFASSTRTFRGQNAENSSEEDDAWTGRFETYTQRSAQLTANGIYEWIDESWFDSDRSLTPTSMSGKTEVTEGREADKSESHPPEAPAGTNLQSSFPSGETGEESVVESLPGVSSTNDTTAFTGFESVNSFGGHSILTDSEMPLISASGSRKSVTQGKKPTPDSEIGLTGESGISLPHESVALSELTGQVLVSPEQFFSSDEALFLTSSAEDPDEPVIRGQSPDGVRDPAVPGPRDAVLESNPMLNSIPPGWVDINVNAAEGRTGKLMMGAGVNSNSGLVGSFVWDESNFDLFRPPQTFADIIEGRAWRGGGQRFRAEAAPGTVVSRYAVSWTDPYFLYSDYSLTVSGFYFNRFYPDWDEDRVGGRIGVGRQLTPEWSVNTALRLEDVEISDPRTPTPAVLQRDVGHNLLSTGRLSVTHDTRDMAVMPGEGHYADLGYEQAFGQYSFPRVEGDLRQYYTIYNRPDGSGRQVLTLAGNIGWSGDDTPVFERYFAGGFQSFRGFSYRGVTPRSAAGVSTGGVFQMLGTVEYRVPVTADDMINVVAFTDFGSVEEEVTLNNFRMTAGFGLRVVIPAMGPVPLAFDFAFPITSQDIDDERIFSFYVGVNR